ncbi:MAG: 6-phosphofructokinase [Clostridia bacterium]|nr:6-phosphofructokinase [Clostridia bacterium]
MILLSGNAIVGQSGGPTAAINATLSGVIRGVMSQMKKHGCIHKLYGMRNGIAGLLEDKTVCLSDLFDREEKLKLLEQTPAAILGSCRKKLPDPDSPSPEDMAVYQRLFDVLDAYDIRYFFYIGGNDSMDTVAKMSRYSEKHNKGIRVIGIPKTIDNDLAHTDHTPGYGSAAKFIATVMREIVCDCSVYTNRAVTIVEIMGRDAGWLTAAAALGRMSDGVSPDLIYLPERSFDTERFLARLEELFALRPNLVVAVSEGIRFADGRYVGESAQNGVTDVFGHQYLAGTAKVLEAAVRERFGCKVRSIELSLPQRCASHMLSLTDITESIRIGQAAIQAALDGVSGEVMLFERQSTTPYQCTIRHQSAQAIANQIQYVPSEFITESGDQVTDACCEYLLPLIEGECDVLYQKGMPRVLVLPN